ncbi:MAG: IPT/TIG domain-containing protein [Myxococcota bacterium]|nr:IPT/TIG domain-containing protein [Myxococcota bacterium]
MFGFSSYVFLLGCNGKGVITLDDPPDTETEEATGFCDNLLCVEEISPNRGVSSGGTEVRLKGSGFDGNVGVAFNSDEISDVTVLGADILFFDTPPAEEGSVDVIVWSEHGTVVIPEGFVYFNTGDPEEPDTDDEEGEDNPSNDDDNDDANNDGNDEDNGDGNDDDSDDSNNGTELVGGIVQLSLIVDGFRIASDQGYSISASVMLHEPTNGSWLSWVPELGSCENNTPTPLSSTGIDLGENIFLNYGNISIPLADDGSTYTASALTSDFYIKGVGYDLDAPDIGLEISDAVVTAPGLGATFGPTNFFVGTEYAYYSSENTVFTWETDLSEQSSMIFNVEIRDVSDSSIILESFQCHVEDNGSYQIPAERFDQATFGDFLIIQMYRMRRTTTVHPQNGSTIEGFSVTGGIGVALYQ